LFDRIEGKGGSFHQSGFCVLEQIAENHRIRVITTDGLISTIAGNGDE
jgi:hypothetical protein